jgi:hypothetical protein
MSKEIENKRIGTHCDKCGNAFCICQVGGPLTEPMKSIEEFANELFPLVDTLPRETGYHENDVSEKQQEAFIKGYELANSKTTNHLKKLIEEVKEKVDDVLTDRAGFDKITRAELPQSIDQVLKEYLTNNELN